MTLFNSFTVRVISKADPDAQVTTVFSVDEGLETLKRRAPEDLPDFIFVDISMPIKSGFALIDELLAHCPGPFMQPCVNTAGCFF